MPSLAHVSKNSISDVFSAVFVEDVSDLTLQSNFALLAQLEIKPYLVKQISWFNISSVYNKQKDFEVSTLFPRYTKIM